MATEIGVTLDALARTIASRRSSGDESYTHRLLTGPEDKLLKKVMEEAGEVALACKDLSQVDCVDGLSGKDAQSGYEAGELEAICSPARDHLRYEAADVVYHLLVVLERYGITLDELAAELNARMTDEERPDGASVISPEHINRG